MPSRRAAHGTVPPGISAPTTTTTNTTENTRSAPGPPASTGNIARMIGTAPRSPTQPDEHDSRKVIAEGASSTPTTSGRATSARNSARATPLRRDPGCAGWEHNSPSTRNIATWLSHASASWKRQQRRAVRKRRCRGSTAGDVHRQEAAAVEQRRHAEGEQRQRQREHRVEPAGRQPAAAQHAAPRNRRPRRLDTAHQELHRAVDDQPGETVVGAPRGRRHGIWVSASVSSTAIGSLRPDSTSSVAPTRPRSWMPLPRSTENTAAASVEDTIAPSSSACGQGQPSRCAAGRPGRRLTTPSVASAAAGASARRTACERRVQAAVEEDQRERQRAEPEGQPGSSKRCRRAPPSPPACRPPRKSSTTGMPERRDARLNSTPTASSRPRTTSSQATFELQLGGHGGGSLPGAPESRVR